MSEQTEWLANPGYAVLVSGRGFRSVDLIAAMSISSSTSP
jgi:hypothetical protein